MSVQKFRSFEEAEQALWCFSPDKNYYKRVRNFYNLISSISHIQYPHGIFKYKNLTEADRDKMKWILNSVIHKNHNK